MYERNITTLRKHSSKSTKSLFGYGQTNFLGPNRNLVDSDEFFPSATILENVIKQNLSQSMKI